jgi:DNA-binding response OmpR family regulator
MKSPLPKTVLVIEDDTGLRLTMATALEEAGYEVRACADAEEGLELAAAFRPTLVFCDVHLEQGDGRTVLARLREDETLRDCQFVLMTGDWVGASQRESIDSGADGYLAKPFSIEELLACVKARFAQANL